MVRLYGIVRTTKTFPIIIGRSMAELTKIRMCNMMITRPIKTNVVCKSTRMENGTRSVANSKVDLFVNSARLQTGIFFESYVGKVTIEIKFPSSITII